MTRLLDSAERIAEVVNVIVCLAIIAWLVIADQWGAVVWLGAG